MALGFGSISLFSFENLLEKLVTRMGGGNSCLLLPYILKPLFWPVCPSLGLCRKGRNYNHLWMSDWFPSYWLLTWPFYIACSMLCMPSERSQLCARLSILEGHQTLGFPSTTGIQWGVGGLIGKKTRPRPESSAMQQHHFWYTGSDVFMLLAMWEVDTAIEAKTVW